MTVLQIENLSKRYGPIVVADDLNFAVARGECLGVIGPNGAGKTSLLNLIDGSVRAAAGRVLLEGDDISAVPQHERVRRGVSRAYQIPQAFAALTVFENVLTAACFGANQSLNEAEDFAAQVLTRTSLASKAERVAGSLPLLDRKRLELARALGSKPKLLLLDEIAGGLTEMEVSELVQLIAELKQSVAMIWIEHVAHALLAVADRMLALDFGACVALGESARVMNDARVQEIYFGVEPDAVAVG